MAGGVRTIAEVGLWNGPCCFRLRGVDGREFMDERRVGMEGLADKSVAMTKDGKTTTKVPPTYRRRQTRQDTQIFRAPLEHQCREVPVDKGDVHEAAPRLMEPYK